MKKAIFRDSSFAFSTSFAMNPTGLTRIAEPFPKLLYGFGASEKTQQMNLSPYPTSGYARPSICMDSTAFSERIE